MANTSGSFVSALFVSLASMAKFSIVFLVLSALVFTAQGQVQGASIELASLTAKFQSLIHELGGEESLNTVKPEIASMLQRLEQFQSSLNTGNQNSTSQWLPSTYTKASSMRITLVVSSFEGMYLNSGIGTFYSALSDFLVHHGHTVTILYTRTDSSDTSSLFARWQKSLEGKGVSIVRMDPLPVHVSSPSITQKSYQVYQYLKHHQQEFDVVHFPDSEGAGYFSIIAKHQGLAFASKVFIVGLHGPLRWLKHSNNEALTSVEDVEIDWLERKSVELADVVVTPAGALPRFLTAQGWDLPPASSAGAPTKLSVLPFLPGKEIQMINRRQKDKPFDHKKTKVEEFVFFGRLETRKGMLLFADALDALAASRPALSSLKITFLGKPTNASATEFIESRAKQAQWPFKVTYITHKDRKGALSYLGEEKKGRVAVVPVVVDSAPYAVYECVYTRIPFIATNLPSLTALVRDGDRENVFFEPEAASLAQLMEKLLDSGVVPARSAVSVEDAVSTWESFYDMMSYVRRERLAALKPTVQADARTLPLVSVCVPYYNRPQFLAMALESIKQQDYPLSRIEVVLVDDGSTNEDAIAYVNGLKASFDAQNWQIIRTENKYLGAARNTAARAARGEYILFLDDDNLAKPSQISTYVSVARITGADVFTAAHHVFRGASLPSTYAEKNNNIESMSLPLGPAVSVGIFKNCFGDANFFIRKTTFENLGGFTEERGVGAEDYEFLAKAVLSRARLEAIPEPLLFYRMHNSSEQMMYTTSPDANAVRAALPYASVLDAQAQTDSLLKLLAYRRVGTRAEILCNMTLYEPNPSRINALQVTTIEFRATNIDCEVTDLYIGSYRCDNLEVNAAAGIIRCTTPAIPFPAKYGISASFAELPDFPPKPMDRFLEVVKRPVNGSSIAVLAIRFLSDDTLYTLQKLWNLFEQFTGLAAELIDFLVIDDVVSDQGARKRAMTDLHAMRFALFSRDPEDDATGVALNLIKKARASPGPLLAIGVIILDFQLVGSCDEFNNCVCTPTYAGEGCDEEASCDDDCNDHGECVNGPFSKVCRCHPGWTGKTCNIKTCVNDCSGHGSCRITMDSNASGQQVGECLCDPGWTHGELQDCSKVSGCPNDCSGYGTCQEGVCLCDDGRSGDDCSGDGDGLGGVKERESGEIAGLAVAVAFFGVTLLVALGLWLYSRNLRRRQ